MDQGWLITVGLSQEGSSSLERRVLGERRHVGEVISQVMLRKSRPSKHCCFCCYCRCVEIVSNRKPHFNASTGEWGHKEVKRFSFLIWNGAVLEQWHLEHLQVYLMLQKLPKFSPATENHDGKKTLLKISSQTFLSVVSSSLFSWVSTDSEWVVVL